MKFDVITARRQRGRTGDALDRLFRITAHGSTISREIVGGVTTFAAMSYVVVVNPAILSQAGMDRGELIIATTLVAMIGTLLMGLSANLPIGMAPGMGPNVVFAQIVVLQLGVSWQTGLAMIFMDGVIFLALALSRWRQQIVAGFPTCIKIGIQCGIGLMIAYIGLHGSGLAVTEASGALRFGALSQPATLLTLVGLIATPGLIALRIPGAFLISILILTVVGLFVPAPGGHGYVTALPDRFIAAPVIPHTLIGAWDFAGYARHFFLLLPISIYLFVSDFFSATSTFMCIGERAKLLDPDRSLPKARRAFTADALSTMCGASLGTSTVCAYVESVAGVEAGGRTGLTAITTALLFGLALFLWPLFSIIPPQATAPTLIFVGVMMMEGLTGLSPTKPEECYPAILVLAVTVTTMDLAAGMAVGCLVHTLMLAVQRRWRSITPTLLAIDAMLLLYFVACAAIR